MEGRHHKVTWKEEAARVPGKSALKPLLWHINEIVSSGLVSQQKQQQVIPEWVYHTLGKVITQLIAKDG